MLLALAQLGLFMASGPGLAKSRRLLESNGLVADSRLIKAYSNHKSFVLNDGSYDSSGDFRGKKRSNSTHDSKTNPMRN